MSIQDTQQCLICYRQINTTIFTLHEAYCERNMQKCTDCDEIIDRNELEDHNLIHLKDSCIHCLQMFEKNIIENHLKICTYKPRECQFCCLLLISTQYVTHIEECGNRTEPCCICNVLVRRAMLEEHIMICQFMLDEVKNVPDIGQNNQSKTNGTRNNKIQQTQNEKNDREFIVSDKNSDSSYIIQSDSDVQFKKQDKSNTRQTRNNKINLNNGTDSQNQQQFQKRSVLDEVKKKYALEMLTSDQWKAKKLKQSKSTIVDSDDDCLPEEPTVNDQLNKDDQSKKQKKK